MTASTELHPTEGSCAVVDFGGTKIAAALVQGRSILQQDRIATDGTASADTQIAAIAGLLQRFAGRAAHFGVALTGMVHDGIWRPVNVEMLSGFDEIDVQARLERTLGAPVVVLNDALAATWGEYRFGAGLGSSNLLYITVSTGVGGGFVLNGRLHQSACGLASHIGFAVVDPNGPACGSGRRGTLEAVASGTAIARDASAARGRPCTAVDVFEAARDGEAWADDLINRSAAAVARSIADYKAALGIERVVVGGGVGTAESYVERIRLALQSEPALFQPTVAKATLGSAPVLIGTADWAIRSTVSASS